MHNNICMNAHMHVYVYTHTHTHKCSNIHLYTCSIYVCVCFRNACYVHASPFYRSMYLYKKHIHTYNIYTYIYAYHGEKGTCICQGLDNMYICIACIAAEQHTRMHNLIYARMRTHTCAYTYTHGCMHTYMLHMHRAHRSKHVEWEERRGR
jgi:hypothetical protein